MVERRVDLLGKHQMTLGLGKRQLGLERLRPDVPLLPIVAPGLPPFRSLPLEPVLPD